VTTNIQILNKNLLIIITRNDIYDESID
jgi:hypothetical protein